MTKLSDIQAVILSAASQRDDGAVLTAARFSQDQRWRRRQSSRQPHGQGPDRSPGHPARRRPTAAPHHPRRPPGHRRRDRGRARGRDARRHGHDGLPDRSLARPRHLQTVYAAAASRPAAISSGHRCQAPPGRLQLALLRTRLILSECRTTASMFRREGVACFRLIRMLSA
jgi:hypothetical protein